MDVTAGGAAVRGLDPTDQMRRSRATSGVRLDRAVARIMIEWNVGVDPADPDEAHPFRENGCGLRVEN